MSFDAHSLERLRALGRQLPQRLPEPTPPPQAPRAQEGRHPVETEQDPEALFRELMKASPDGSVPPHLLERLRQTERRRRAPAPSADHRGGAGRPRRAAGSGTAAGIRAEEEAQLYVDFQQLLLENEED